MYEVFALDHLAAKVETLFQKLDKLSVNVVTPPSVKPPCEICGVVGHIGIDFQLGVSAVSPKQANYAQRNFSNPFGQQSAPSGFVNLELLLENFVLSQQKQNQELKNKIGFLNESLIKSTSKVDSIATHNKILENQVSQVAEQVPSSSKTFRIFLGQPKPKT